MPGFVYVDRIGADADHFSAHLLEVDVQGAKFFQFSGTNERKVTGVKYENQPPAAVALQFDVTDLLFVERLKSAVGDDLSDCRHATSNYLMLWGMRINSSCGLASGCDRSDVPTGP
jgi:hypothetical protein